jgi:hypothetical protein
LTPVAHRLFSLLGQLSSGLNAEDRDELLGDAGFDAEETLLRIGLAIERDNRLDLLSPVRDRCTRYHPPTPLDNAAWPRHYLALTRRLGEVIGFKADEGGAPSPARIR